MPKIPEDIKTKWVAALRSGKYKQGRIFLNRDKHYCCLGVLCEVMNVPATGKDIKVYGEDWRSSFLPKELRTITGMTAEGHITNENDSIVSVVINGDEYVSLVAMNDNDLSFETIANVIEEHF